MRKMLCLAVVCLMALSAVFVAPPNASMAAPYYVRGDFNGWAGIADLMIDQGGGLFTYTVTGLTAGTSEEMKAVSDDWSEGAPGSNAKIPVDAAGEIKLRFFNSTVWADGWEPSAKSRLGWTDPDTFDWEIAGAMNGWAGGDLLVDQGNGLHVGQIALLAGNYDWKFRQQGSWDHSMGDDTGNAAANNNITVASDGDVWGFQLDILNGRWQASLVPEPSSMALAGLALMGIVFSSARRENRS